MYEQFTVNGKRVDIYPAAALDCPVIYLNNFSSDSRQVRHELGKLNSPDHSLIVVSGLEWDHDMAPWDIPPISENDTPCTGGADDYLLLLTKEIIPRAEKFLPGPPSWRGLAGYSLAGLFALYAMYRTSLFSNIASMSGSLWFPDFKEYAMSHKLKRTPEHLYLSLGDKECMTSNPYLKVVQTNTEDLAAFYQSRKIDTIFCLNHGNHYAEPFRRTALGILWLLSR